MKSVEQLKEMGVEQLMELEQEVGGYLSAIAVIKQYKELVMKNE